MPVRGTRSSSLILPILLFALVAAACGDDSTATTTATTATTTSAGQTVPPAPTELRFTVDALAGAQGKTIVVSVIPSGGGPGVGTACLQVDADPWSGTGVAATSAPDNPCNHDAPYGVPITADGSYAYLIGVYTPGQQIAEMCGSGEVTLAGPTEVTLSQSDFSTSC